jgi:hypothetical protein
MEPKPIEGYENNYIIYPDGRIYSKMTRIFLKPSPDKEGYCRVSLMHDKKCRTFYIHRLVAKHFHDNPSNHPQVNHKDGNINNNHYRNLEWCTDTENRQHYYVLRAKKNKWWYRIFRLILP